MSTPVRGALPATLVGGYLGAGKTTLLSKLLQARRHERLAVIVNDFGALSIDAELIAEVTTDTISLVNGCVCCTIQGDLIETVQRLLQRREPPDRLLVELSGASDSAAVARTFAIMEKAWPVELDGVVVLVDAECFPHEGSAELPFALEQVAMADIVVVSKGDLAGADQTRQLMARLRARVPHVRLVEGCHGDVSDELILGLAHHGMRAATAQTLATNDRDGRHQRFVSVCWTSRQPVVIERLREVVTELPPWVFRAKGVLYVTKKPENRAVLQVVGRRARLSLGAPWITDLSRQEPECRVVFIGPAPSTVDVAVLRDAVARSLDACAASATEPAPGQRGILEIGIEWVRSRFS